MGKRIPEVDNVIDNAAPFAQPIMQHLRELVHKACPEADEAIKWKFPAFIYNKKILCGMAAFKAHATFGFWNQALMDDPDHIFEGKDGTAMGSLGALKSLKDLPPDKILTKYIKASMQLIDAGVKASPAQKKANGQKELLVPEELTKALAKNKKAQSAFEAFSYSCKKEYVEWIAEAKQEATKQKRIDTAVEWIAEGKIRNWKYIK